MIIQSINSVKKTCVLLFVLWIIFLNSFGPSYHEFLIHKEDSCSTNHCYGPGISNPVNYESFELPKTVHRDHHEICLICLFYNFFNFSFNKSSVKVVKNFSVDITHQSFISPVITFFVPIEIIPRAPPAV